MSIMIIYRETHENIPLFIIVIVTIFILEVIIIYKVIHSKNCEKLYKLLFKAHGN